MVFLLIEILRRSIWATCLIGIIFLMRKIFEKFSLNFYYELWLLVICRLLFPTKESRFSLMPSNEWIPQTFMELGQNYEVIRTSLCICAWIWMCGLIVILGVILYKYVVIKRKINISIHLYDNVWINDNVESPFILGVSRSRIYIPPHLSEKDLKYVLLHEKEHMKRHDPWKKIIFFLIATIYWMNPIIWVAYYIMCRDMELACDERVLGNISKEERKTYAETLLRLSGNDLNNMCSVSFGEVSIKYRVKKILGYRVPTCRMLLGAIVLIIFLCLCFMTNPIQENDSLSLVLAEQVEIEIFGGTAQGKILYINKEKNPEIFLQITNLYNGLELCEISEKVSNEGTGYTFYDSKGRILVKFSIHGDRLVKMNGKVYLLSEAVDYSINDRLISENYRYGLWQ